MTKKQANKESEVKDLKQAEEQSKAIAEVGSMGDMAAWGASTQVTSQDIIIPRLLVMQPMSEKVTAGDAQFGDIRESLSNEKFGDFTNPIMFVPFYMEKVFIEFNVEDPDDKKFLRVVPITPANESLPYEDEEFDQKLGKKIKISRDRTMNFYVLRPEEVELGSAIPYILSCRRSNMPAGKKLTTQMYVKNINSGKNPAAVVMRLSVSKQSNEKKQTWAVMDIVPHVAASEALQKEAFKWLKLVKSGQAKVDENSYSEEARTESTVDAKVTDVSMEKGPAQF